MEQGLGSRLRPGTGRSTRASTHTPQGEGPGSSPPAPLLLGRPLRRVPTHTFLEHEPRCSPLRRQCLICFPDGPKRLLAS